MAKVRELP